MRVFKTITEWRTARAALPPDVPLAFVPTMGALHDGHAGLIRQARQRVGTHGQVAASIFVNPTQFAPTEDLARYPRTLDADMALLTASGADFLFAPSAEEMYPPAGAHMTIDPGALGAILEGVFRPTHFRGVCTVVAKLLNIVAPTYLFLGQKDYQQLVVLKRMIADLDMPVEVIAAPTAREPDGLAMSSRNRYLSPADRAKAPAIFAALSAAADLARRPGASANAVCQAVSAPLASADFHVQYVALADPDTLEEQSGAVRLPAVLLIAAILGKTRLIDNICCTRLGLSQI